MEEQKNELVEIKNEEIVEPKKEKNPRKTFWILIGIGSLILVLFIIISNVLDVGERLRTISGIGQYLEYGFYALAALLFYFLILNPLRIILFSPTFQIITVLDEDNKKSYKVYKKVANTLIKNNQLDQEDVKKLIEGIKDRAELRETLSRVYESSIKKQINKIILNNAKTVFISTAMSQNGKLDMITVLTCNIKMIKEIVVKSGFRPTYVKLGKLSTKVLSTALIAEGLEGLDFTDLFPTSSVKWLEEVPVVKTLANSVVNGLANGLLTLRIGIATRRYLFSDVKKITKEEIRRKSIKESVRMLPLLVKEVIVFFPKKFAGLFKKKDEQDFDESIDPVL